MITSVADRHPERSTYVKLYFLNYFARAISEIAELIFTKFSRKTANKAAIANLTFWFLNSFGGGRQVQKGHFRFGFITKICQGSAEIVWCIRRSYKEDRGAGFLAVLIV